MTVTDLSEVAERVEREVRDAMRMPTLDAVRAILNEAGIRRARRALAEAPDRLAEAQNAFREAQARETLAREGYTQALLEAEWEVSGNLHKDGNKTYRWIDCECAEMNSIQQNQPMKSCPLCSGDGKYRQFMLADEVAKWKAYEAAKMPAVVVVAAELRRTEENTAAARDAVAVADKRFSAAKYELTAAVAELNALAAGLATKGA